MAAQYWLEVFGVVRPDKACELKELIEKMKAEEDEPIGYLIVEKQDGGEEIGVMTGDDNVWGFDSDARDVLASALAPFVKECIIFSEDDEDHVVQAVGVKHNHLYELHAVWVSEEGEEFGPVKRPGK